MSWFIDAYPGCCPARVGSCRPRGHCMREWRKRASQVCSVVVRARNVCGHFLMRWLPACISPRAKRSDKRRGIQRKFGQLTGVRERRIPSDLSASRQQDPDFFAMSWFLSPISMSAAGITVLRGGGDCRCARGSSGERWMETGHTQA
jgi:hypothetical protein